MADDAPDERTVTAAARMLAHLNQQADLVRGELRVLRRDLAQVERDFTGIPAAQVLEANEQLVLAATRAQSLADKAKRNLDELKRAAREQLEQQLGLLRAEQEARFGELREANEKLLLAALNSKELESHAQTAHRRQITFVAMVAHELRNPLVPLKLASHMLAGASADELLLAKLRSTIDDQVAHMGRLIGDLLDGSRISTGKFTLVRSVLDLEKILELAIEAGRPSFGQRLQRFSSSVPPGPLWVNGDRVRMLQVFGNLLDNASKYTPQGGEISLVATRSGETLSIRLADNGIGITPKALPHVFELFVQETHAVEIDNSGLGIGLAVVRDLVEAHGGSVTASSAGQGQGSQFVVTLPLLEGNAVR